MPAPTSRRLALAALALALLAAGAGLWWWTHRHLVSTEDAYVQADVALVTPRVAGTVAEVPVDESWQVERGALLVRLDPAAYRLRLAQAEAELVRARHELEAARVRVRAAEAGTRLAEAQLELARHDAARNEALARKHVVSEEDLDRVHTSLRVARARLAAAREEEARARAALGIPLDAPDDRSPLVRRARAARDQAALDLEWTEIRAPIAGIVADKGVDLGQHVAPGQPLMRIVPLDRAYVEANFKETQLTDVRIGQPATVVADIYPGREYKGVVASLSAGTGAAFALLPPENATGNWIKVVQRVPVKILLTDPSPPDPPLRVGLSVEATIDTRDTSGELLRPLGQKANGSVARAAGE